MRISELKVGNGTDPDVMTIQDMYNYCCEAIDEGLGDRILMIPNDGVSKVAADYRCLSNYFDSDDSAEHCAYLEVLEEKEEKFVSDNYFQY